MYLDLLDRQVRVTTQLYLLCGFVLILCTVRWILNLVESPVNPTIKTVTIKGNKIHGSTGSPQFMTASGTRILVAKRCSRNIGCRATAPVTTIPVIPVAIMKQNLPVISKGLIPIQAILRLVHPSPKPP